MRRLEDDLDLEERRIRSEHSGLKLGYLPARFLNPARLPHVWVDLLAKLLDGRSTTVIVNNVYSVDAESIFLIRLLVGRITDGSLRFVLGYDYKPEKVGNQDLVEGLLRNVIDRVMTGLKALPQSREIDRDRWLAEVGSKNPAQEVLLDCYRELDDASELQALTATRERNGGSSVSSDLIFRGLRDSFGCFGFGSAAQIGTSLLENAVQEVQEDILGEVRRLTALSLYNQYFFTGYSAKFLGLKNPRNVFSPEDLAGVAVAHLACGGGSRQSIEQAIELVPAALEDLNAWWELPRLVPAVLELLEEGKPELETEECDASCPSGKHVETSRAGVFYGTEGAGPRSIGPVGEDGPPGAAAALDRPWSPTISARVPSAQLAGRGRGLATSADDGDEEVRVSACLDDPKCWHPWHPGSASVDAESGQGADTIQSCG